MSETERPPDASPAPDDGASALEAGRMLMELALRYWSEDRPEEAVRVARQAVAALAAASADPAVRAEAEATVRGIEHELRHR